MAATGAGTRSPKRGAGRATWLWIHSLGVDAAKGGAPLSSS